MNTAYNSGLTFVKDLFRYYRVVEGDSLETTEDDMVEKYKKGFEWYDYSSKLNYYNVAYLNNSNLSKNLDYLSFFVGKLYGNDYRKNVMVLYLGEELHEITTSLYLKKNVIPLLKEYINKLNYGSLETEFCLFAVSFRKAYYMGMTNYLADVQCKFIKEIYKRYTGICSDLIRVSDYVSALFSLGRLETDVKAKGFPISLESNMNYSVLVLLRCFHGLVDDYSTWSKSKVKGNYELTIFHGKTFLSDKTIDVPTLLKGSYYQYVKQTDSFMSDVYETSVIKLKTGVSYSKYLEKVMGEVFSLIEKGFYVHDFGFNLHLRKEI